MIVWFWPSRTHHRFLEVHGKKNRERRRKIEKERESGREEGEQGERERGKRAGGKVSLGVVLCISTDSQLRMAKKREKIEIETALQIGIRDIYLSLELEYQG